MGKYFDFAAENIAKPLFSIYYQIFHRCTWYGLDNIPCGGAILCANHISNLDGPLVSCRIRGRMVRWVAKEELYHHRIMAWCMRNLGAVRVDRSKADIRPVRDLLALLRKDELVGIFPEGTRMKNRARHSVQVNSSPVMLSARTGKPVVPVAICGRYRLFGKMQLKVGPPEFYQNDSRNKPGPEEQEARMRQLMGKIYRVVDGGEWN